MLSVAVCDDNPVFLEEARGALRRDKRVAEIELYTEAEKLIQQIVNDEKKFDVILMDIEFKHEKTGIEYAQEIYQCNPSLPVIYMTGYNDRYAQHVLLTDVNLVGYLIKPLDQSLLSQYLDRVYIKRGRKIFFTFSVRGKECTIAPESILYLESHNHTVTIYTDEEKYVIYDKLGNLLERLPSVFVQCHKSFVINMNRIYRLDINEFLLTDGSSIPISKTYVAKVRAAFFRHIGQML